MSYTHESRIDGFGAQYQTIINTIIYCMENNINYLYSPLKNVEHNYENDPNYINKLENLMNLKENVKNRDDTTIEIKFGSTVLIEFEKSIDRYCNSETMKCIKECFWRNKERDFFKNGKMNISVHIRRENNADKGQCGARGTTPNEYYIRIMNEIRAKYNGNQLQFHIYSQGIEEDFEILKRENVEFHLNEEITTTFIGMVAADILVISPSSLSYVAGLLSDGIVYYKPFWHSSRKEWIICG
jgi:hypothetical protein